jgi:D-alanyl-D-alanine carboxypeptidase
MPDPELVRPIGRGYPLPPDFLPSELCRLVSYPSIQVTPGKEAMQGHPEAVASLSRLFEAARGAGLTNLYVQSAYRSMATQAYLWESAGGDNQRRVAPPGMSEHQSGLAFDFAAAPYGTPSGFEATPASRWLRAHAHRFGFVCTYPRAGIDGIAREPWHYRYVGVQVSTRLYELGYLDPTSTLNPIEFYADLLQGSRS